MTSTHVIRRIPLRILEGIWRLEVVLRGVVSLSLSAASLISRERLG